MSEKFTFYYYLIETKANDIRKIKHRHWENKKQEEAVLYDLNWRKKIWV